MNIKYTTIIFGVLLLLMSFGYGSIGTAEAQTYGGDALDDIQNLTENETADQTVMRDITPRLSVIDVKIEDGDTLITVKADTPQPVTVIYKTSGGYTEWFTVDVQDGTTNIRLSGEYNRIAVGSTNRAYEFEIQGDSIINEIGKRATAEQIPIGILGGGFGTIAGFLIWVLSQRIKKDTKFIEVIFGYEEIQVRDNATLTSRIVNKIKQNKLISGGIVAGIISIIAYTKPSLNDIPVDLIIIVLAVIVMYVITFFISPAINKRFEIYKPNEAIIAEINASRADRDGDITAGKIPIKAWVASPKLIEKVNISGEKRTIKYMNKTMHIVIDFDPHNMDAQSADMMQVPEEELMGYLEAVEENRSRTSLVRRWALRAFRSVSTLTDRVATEHQLQFQKKERGQTTYKAEEIESILTEEIPEYGELMNKSVTDEYEDLRDQFDTADSPDSNTDDTSSSDSSED